MPSSSTTRRRPSALESLLAAHATLGPAKDGGPALRPRVHPLREGARSIAGGTTSSPLDSLLRRATRKPSDPAPPRPPRQRRVNSPRSTGRSTRWCATAAACARCTWAAWSASRAGRSARKKRSRCGTARKAASGRTSGSGPCRGGVNRSRARALSSPPSSAPATPTPTRPAGLRSTPACGCCPRALRVRHCLFRTFFACICPEPSHPLNRFAHKNCLCAAMVDEEGNDHLKQVCHSFSGGDGDDGIDFSAPARIETGALRSCLKRELP